MRGLSTRLGRQQLVGRIAGLHTQVSNPMYANRQSSGQQRRAACSTQTGQRMPALPLPQDDAAERSRPTGARPIVNETKGLIVAVMREFDRPITSSELYAIWNGTKPLKTFEYHLSTLVKAKVAEVVFGPELHFQLVGETTEPTPSVRERCRWR